jgi:hypothetical protein
MAIKEQLRNSVCTFQFEKFGRTKLVAERSKERVYGRSLAGITVSNPAGGMDGCPLCCVCCQVEVSATGWSLVQRSPTDCGASLCVISETL